MPGAFVLARRAAAVRRRQLCRSSDAIGSTSNSTTAMTTPRASGWLCRRVIGWPLEPARPQSCGAANRLLGFAAVPKKRAGPHADRQGNVARNIVLAGLAPGSRKHRCRRAAPPDLDSLGKRHDEDKPAATALTLSSMAALHEVADHSRGLADGCILGERPRFGCAEPEADSAIPDFRDGLASIIGLHEIGIGLLHVSNIRALGMGRPCISRARWPCPS